MNRSTAWLLSAIWGLVIPAMALAGPITTVRWTEDERHFGTVAFAHGPVVPGFRHSVEGPFTSPNGFWEVRALSIDEIRGGNGIDGVVITPQFKHKSDPGHHEVEGPLFVSVLNFSADSPPMADDEIMRSSRPSVLGHDGHFNEGFSAIAGTRNAARTRITEFRTAISGKHHLSDPRLIPEPSTLLLVGSGLAGIIGFRSKRRIK